MLFFIFTMKASLFLIAFLSIFLIGCASTSQDTVLGNDSQAIHIAATFFPYYDAVKQIVPSHFDVHSVVGLSAEPHSFELSARDISRLSGISLFVATGVEFEAFEERIIQSLDSSVPVLFPNEGITFLHSDHHHHDHGHSHSTHHDDEHKYDFDVIEATCISQGGVWIEEHHECEFIQEDVCVELSGHFVDCHSACRHTDDDVCIDLCVPVCSFEDDSHHEKEHDYKEDSHKDDDHDKHSNERKDPHVWLSITNMKSIAQQITTKALELFPEYEETITQNSAMFLSELQALHEEYEQGLSVCAKDTIFVTHNAFSYLARDYNFSVVSISGLSHESEPTPRQLAHLIDEAREKNISVIFFEEMVSSRVSETIAQEVGARTLVLSPAEGSPDGKSFIEIMRANLVSLKEGLECQ